MRKTLHIVTLTLAFICSPTYAAKVEIIKDKKGFKLQVDNQEVFVKGINWGYIPKGKNYNYKLWQQDRSFIERVLKSEMSLLRDGGFNAIRIYSDIPPEWVTYIYKNFGIYSIINHTAGRYGMQYKGSWVEVTDYSNPEAMKVLKDQIAENLKAYRNTEGVLFYLLGNENNYGLHWTNYEIANLPKEEKDLKRATALYQFFQDAIVAVKKMDSSKPVAIANGDLQYIDLIKKYCKDLDILGSNVYRGPDATDYFAKVAKVLNLPTIFTEFGADAFNMATGKEDHLSQARFLLSQWTEIYQEAYGLGSHQNSLGGLTFQWSDGWWKHLQEQNLDTQDMTASWENAGYYDHVAGQNNMNEEWFGIAAKGLQDESGFFESIPRTAYYVMQEIFKKSPSDFKNKAQVAQEHRKINISQLSSIYASSNASQPSLRATPRIAFKHESVKSGGNSLLKERESWKTFDYTQSYDLGLDIQAPRVKATVNLNIVENAAQNRLHQIYFENRQNYQTVQGVDGKTYEMTDDPNVIIRNSSFSWDGQDFQLKGFYRTQHGDWSNEGDFFNLYRNTYDLSGIDRYYSKTPVGFELDGKNDYRNWKFAFGPEVYWGANPSIIAKYSNHWGSLKYSIVHQHEVAQASAQKTSSVVPEDVSKRTTIHGSTNIFGLEFDLGLLHSGAEKIGDKFTRAQKSDTSGYRDSGYDITDDHEIVPQDTVGVKAKLQGRMSSFRWYTQVGFKGLVANSGPDQTVTITGWNLKESGRGNHYHGFLGGALDLGALQIAPLFLYQKPLEGPLPPTPELAADQLDSEGTLLPGVPARNIKDDPFVVLDNRETQAVELLITYDPTPATWFYHWDRANIEDAGFAANLDFIYKKQPTSRDSNFAFTADGVLFPFGSAPSAYDVWDLYSNLFWRLDSSTLQVSLFTGEGQSNGLDERIIKRKGFSVLFDRHQWSIKADVKIDDWGPYDYHKDYNLTYPLQGALSINYQPKLGGFMKALLGLSYQYRTLDSNSENYPTAVSDGKKVKEYEISTSVNVSI